VDIEAIKKEGTNPILTGKSEIYKINNQMCINLQEQDDAIIAI
jgi:hypothetical protein